MLDKAEGGAVSGSDASPTLRDKSTRLRRIGKADGVIGYAAIDGSAFIEISPTINLSDHLTYQAGLNEIARVVATKIDGVPFDVSQLVNEKNFNTPTKRISSLYYSDPNAAGIIKISLIPYPDGDVVNVYMERATLYIMGFGLEADTVVQVFSEFADKVILSKRVVDALGGSSYHALGILDQDYVLTRQLLLDGESFESIATSLKNRQRMSKPEIKRKMGNLIVALAEGVRFKSIAAEVYHAIKDTTRSTSPMRKLQEDFTNWRTISLGEDVERLQKVKVAHSKGLLKSPYGESIVSWKHIHEKPTKQKLIRFQEAQEETVKLFHESVGSQLGDGAQEQWAPQSLFLGAEDVDVKGQCVSLSLGYHAALIEDYRRAYFEALHTYTNLISSEMRSVREQAQAENFHKEMAQLEDKGQKLIQNGASDARGLLHKVGGDRSLADSLKLLGVSGTDAVHLSLTTGNHSLAVARTYDSSQKAYTFYFRGVP